MRKFIILSFMLLSCSYLSSFAQKYGITAGFNFSNMAIKEDNEPGELPIETSIKTGFHVGPILEFRIKSNLSFKTGIIYSSQGYKYNAHDSYEEINGEITLNYLQVPLTATLAYQLGDNKFYGILGSYLSYGLTGKEKWGLDGHHYEYNIEWGKDEDYARLDYGLDFGAGIEIKSIQIEFRYKLGLRDIQPPSNDGWSSKNRVIGISISYFLVSK